MRPFVAWLLASFAVGCAAPAPRDPLPSWNDTALDEARAKHWTVVDMKTDWARIFAFEPK
jgi:hypothetical protein